MTSPLNQSIPSDQSQVQEFDIEFLNSFLKNKRSTYEFLSNVHGYFPPSFESKAITEDYLFKVLQKKVFLLKREEVNPAPEQKQRDTIPELMEELKKYTGGKELGYDFINPPDKQYLLDALYSLKKDHP
jgi:hypothetical protein